MDISDINCHKNTNHKRAISSFLCRHYFITTNNVLRCIINCSLDNLSVVDTVDSWSWASQIAFSSYKKNPNEVHKCVTIVNPMK